MVRFRRHVINVIGLLEGQSTRYAFGFIGLSDSSGAKREKWDIFTDAKCHFYGALGYTVVNF